jgi:pyruvate/2-oxoglutarate dehydrogenase complex dihydrolipoamide acyltransferase (E2) component
MADFKVTLPPLGEDAPDEATVSFFYVEEGNDVAEGDDFCEMVTDKATFNVPAPASGKVKEIVVEEDDVVEVGGLLAILETAD